MSPRRNSTNQAGLGMRAYYSRMLGGYADRFEESVLEGPPRAWCNCDVCDKDTKSYIAGADPSHHCAPTSPVGVTYDPDHFSADHWNQDAASEYGTKPVLSCINNDYFSTLQWELDEINSTAHTFKFGKGGNQCGQNSNYCAVWYVENVLQELDHPGEFFYNNATGSLYYYMNDTSSKTEEEASFVASNLEVLVKVAGTAKEPVVGVHFQNITFSHAAPTYLSSQYSTKLGGGDYSIHNGAAVWVSGASGFQMDGCLFERLGGTALMLYGYIREAVVSNNEFVSIGAHAIVSWGTSEMVDGTTPDHPEGTVVEGNFAHEIGIWEKQTCFWFQALTSGTIMRNNVAFNSARALVNFNDGFGGGNVVEQNLFFNSVRETGDHGPINSYDRQPFMTNYAPKTKGGSSQAGSTEEWQSPSYLIRENQITANFFISNFHSKVPIDHDDGSRFYHDSRNVMVFGGTKNYIGGHKKATNSYYIYPEHVSKLDGTPAVDVARAFIARSPSESFQRQQAGSGHQRGAGSNPSESFQRQQAGSHRNRSVGVQERESAVGAIARLPFCVSSLRTNKSEFSGYEDAWENNTCITTVSTPYLFDPSPCNGTKLFPRLVGNTFAVPEGHKLQFPVCEGSVQHGSASLLDWQKMRNYDGTHADAGSGYGSIPSDDELVATIKRMLAF